jgi:hypothetical protein
MLNVQEALSANQLSRSMQPISLEWKSTTNCHVQRAGSTVLDGSLYLQHRRYDIYGEAATKDSLGVRSTL